ncbi:hypothetical protein AVEN_249842-1 [Araneus ventricosus]|uniref:Uncharacterized protein n=1 Tax=Araneus ventricosus TaxID=182803 RepID=A0A4Y2NI47_ARAVE|nr:hypothetical protein AVEN_249842-1 [Araneus ventricosus]
MRIIKSLTKSFSTRTALCGFCCRFKRNRWESRVFHLRKKQDMIGTCTLKTPLSLIGVFNDVIGFHQTESSTSLLSDPECLKVIHCLQKTKLVLRNDVRSFA